jgi:DNA ligase (NAD+)
MSPDLDYFYSIRVEDTDKEKARKDIELLRDEINRHNHYYYVKDAPVITDEEFDLLYRKLVELEDAFPELVSADSPTQRIGAPVEGGFKTVRHEEKMLSLQDAFDYEELSRFFKKAL